MGLLDQIRTKPTKAKIRLIWIITAVVFVLLIALWIIIGNYSYGNVNKDMTIFQTMEQGIKDFKSNVNK